MENDRVNPGRRRFLKIGSLAGAGLLVGVYFTAGGERKKSAKEVWNQKDDALLPNAWIRIGRDNRVTVRVNHSEMGQGVLTALPMILAEELEVDWSRVRAEIAPAEAVYKNPKFNIQMTGASTSVLTSWEILRQAGATVREMLLSAASKTWAVPRSECYAERGFAYHRQTDRQISYGELVSKAATLPIPENVTLKDANKFKIIGRSIPRLETPSKIDGSAIFGTDIQVPDQWIATVIHPPVFGSKLQSFDPMQSEAIPGVHRVLPLSTAIAIIGQTFWDVQKGADVLKVVWDNNQKDILNSETLREQWEKLARKEGKTIFDRGDPEKALAASARKFHAVYELPFQAHATPEPMNCTAHVRKDRCDIWVPTQNQDGAQETAAKITGLPYKNVHVHTTFLGGGFGRRIETDYVAEAVEISKKIRAPVKVLWAREEDIQHDFYRPASFHDLRAGLDHNGMPVAWTHRIVGPDHMAQRLPVLLRSMLPYWVPRGARNMANSVLEFLLPKVIPGKKACEGAAPLKYRIPNARVDFVHDDPGIPTGFWRSVSYSSNVFVVESFIDEIAHETGKTPFELRYELLKDIPSLQNVLKLASERSRLSQGQDQEKYRGLAVCDFHGTMLAIMAEVSVKPGGEVKVHRVVCAVDCGTVINPRIVEAQMRSGIVFGLTATLKSAVTIRGGRTAQSNLDDFPLLRFDEMPEVDVHIVSSNRPPTGIGETAVPLIAPAVTNAVFAATGKRIRKLPIDPNELKSG